MSAVWREKRKEEIPGLAVFFFCRCDETEERGRKVFWYYFFLLGCGNHQWSNYSKVELNSNRWQRILNSTYILEKQICVWIFSFCPHLSQIDGFAIALPHHGRERRKMLGYKSADKGNCHKEKAFFDKKKAPATLQYKIWRKTGNISKKQETTHAFPPQNTFGISLHTWQKREEGSKVGRAAAHCQKPKRKEKKKPRIGQKDSRVPLWRLLGMWVTIYYRYKYQAGIPHL